MDLYYCILFNLLKNDVFPFQPANMPYIWVLTNVKIGLERHGGVRQEERLGTKNELLCKILCHNIVVIIQSIYELEIEL